MVFIKGIDVILFEKTQTGVDPFGAPIYEETETVVSNVLVSPATQDDVVSSTMLDGTKTTYRLCIPKGDNHEWRDRDVSFFGKRWHTYTETIEYIDENVPLLWNKKILCEEYNKGVE